MTVRSSKPTSRTRLGLLAPREDVLARASHPWLPWFDKVFGIVVRAANEQAARVVAQEQAGQEGAARYRALGCERDEAVAGVWLDRAYTACEPLSAEGPMSVILVDRRRA